MSDVDVKKRRSLNHYAFYPVTVPPFFLEEEFEKCKTKNSNLLSNESIYENANVDSYKDTILNSRDTNQHWGRFVTNIGSNVAYTNNQRSSVVYTDSEGSSSNGTYSNDKQQEVDSEQAEIQCIKEDILADIDAEWGGSERLNALFNQPIIDHYDFKTTKDRKEWSEYISKVKVFYYSNITDLNNSHKSVNNQKNQQDKHHSDWLEELNVEKERWRRLKGSQYQKWKPLLVELLLDSQYVPLSFRIIIIVLCLISLGISVSIYLNSNAIMLMVNEPLQQQASTYMAIVVSSVAVVYSTYIAHDEFTGKPLGLRNPLIKLRLIMLDLLFIIFSSANLALAFNTLFDPNWVCMDDDNGDLQHHYPHVSYICRKQRTLSAFLFFMMFTWVVTFAIAIVRVVEKVSSFSPRF